MRRLDRATQLPVVHAGNGKRGIAPEKPVADASNKRNVMVRGTGFSTSSMPLVETPTKRQYYHLEYQPKQHPTTSLNPHTDVRLYSQWNPQRGQRLRQKLMVSRTVSVAVTHMP